MKNIFFFITVCLLIEVVSQAQTNIGFKAGYNYSTARVHLRSVKQNSEFKNGYGFAIMFKAPFENALHFSPYVAYNRRGYKYSLDTGKIKTIENTIHYIDIAPGLTFDFRIKNKSTFILGVSPVFGFAISGKEKDLYANDSLAINKMIFNYENYGEFDIGFNGSIGYRFNTKFLIEAAFLLGVANIENKDKNKRNIQNRMISLSLGYYFK